MSPARPASGKASSTGDATINTRARQPAATRLVSCVVPPDAIASAVRLSEERFDQALEAVANFVDLKSPYFMGHSRAVAELVAAAGRQVNLPSDDTATPPTEVP